MWAFVADMDESIYSKPTFNRLLQLQMFKFDGVIHNGDFAYNVHTSKGKVGDSYFNAFAGISTVMPFIVSPGNHEVFDDTKFFNYRF